MNLTTMPQADLALAPVALAVSHRLEELGALAYQELVREIAAPPTRCRTVVQSSVDLPSHRAHGSDGCGKADLSTPRTALLISARFAVGSKAEGHFRSA